MGHDIPASKRLLRAAPLLPLLAVSMPAMGLDPAEQAAALADLKAEVAALQDTFDAAQDQLRADLRALELQNTEVSARIRQESARLDELNRLVQTTRHEMATGHEVDTALSPVLAAAFAATRRTIRDGVPFRVDERLAAVDEIDQAVAKGDMPGRVAMSRLWQVLEDESRLARENALGKTELDFEGQTHLARVARVGMFAMYGALDDGRFLTATRQGSGWAWTAASTEQALAISTLFDALSKNVRTGWFDLPLPEASR